MKRNAVWRRGCKRALVLALAAFLTIGGISSYNISVFATEDAPASVPDVTGAAEDIQVPDLIEVPDLQEHTDLSIPVEEVVLPEEVPAVSEAILPEEVPAVPEAILPEEETVEIIEEEIISDDPSYITQFLDNNTVEKYSGRGVRWGTAPIRQFSKIYMGEGNSAYQMKNEPSWIVLDPKFMNSGERGMFLMSDALIANKPTGTEGNIVFHSGNSREWSGSDAQKWCKTFYDKVLFAERGAVAATYKSDMSYTARDTTDLSGDRHYSFGPRELILNGDRVFFLSAQEVNSSLYGFDDYTNERWYGRRGTIITDDSHRQEAAWWLRSPAYIEKDEAGYVKRNGQIGGRSVKDAISAVPVFNLKSETVLFSSYYSSGKHKFDYSKNRGLMMEMPVVTDVPHWWHLTLRDDGSADSVGRGHKGFSAEKLTFDGTTYTVKFSGAKRGSNEYVSVIETNSDKSEILYFSRIANGIESGTASFKHPSGRFASGNRLFIFAEQVNKSTDLASNLVELDMNIRTSIPVTGIALNKKTASIEAKVTNLQLNATVSPSNATNKKVTWKSSDTSVVKVDSYGMISGVKAGTAVITATTADGGYTATCTVTVTGGSSGGGTGDKPVVTAGWKQDSTGWWYQNADGSYPKNTWKKIGGKWYHFDAKGYMQTGWLKDGGKWYYLKSSGEMATGWVKVSGKWYYMNSSGIMQTGWQKISGKWYYFESTGVMLANTSKKIGKKTYTFDKSGVCTNP